MATATAPSKPTTSKTAFALPSMEIPSFEETTKLVQDLNERLLESSKHAGTVTLDAFEKVVQGVIDVEEKVASATDVEWVSSLVATHTKFLTDMSASYSKAARDLLK